MNAPFQQLPWRQVPELPRIPHDYARTRAHDLPMDSAHFGKVSIHWRELGDGPPLLLIHGLMTTSYSWRYVVGELARSHRVIAPDLPGCGRSSMPADRSFSPDALADWIVEFQEALGIRGCYAVGNSMGGYLCMRAALRHPGAFARLVNIHSPAFPELRLHALRAVMALPGTHALLRTLIHRDPLRWVHRNVHYFDETLKSREEAREYGEPLRTHEGAACFARYLLETMSPLGLAEFIRQLAENHRCGVTFPVPLLLLYSRTDPLVNPANGGRLARLIPDARLVWLENTSHFAHVDTPQLVTRELLDPAWSQAA